MNREIRFRAWNQDSQNFGLLTLSAGAHFSFAGLEAFSQNAMKDWQQYTGLKDKNGVEIYEGDVVDINTEGWRGKVALVRYVVKWSLIYAGWRLFPLKKTIDTAFGTDMDKSETLSGWGNRDLEVIGNIFEHPELLEGSGDAR